jgi:GT2 family glycosyltransferase
MVADLSVVLVNWRNEERTIRCIASVRQWQVLKPALAVVDNQSTTSSRKRLAAVLGADELVCSDANLGFAGGNNLGIAHARANPPFVLLINSDAMIADNAVRGLLDRLRDHPEIAILGPVLHERHDGADRSYAGGRDIVQHALTRQAVDARELAQLPGYPLHDVDYVPGTVMLVRRSLFDEIGLLDERFFFSGEVADFCKRARDRGYRVCIDLAVEAHHNAGETLQSLRDTLYVYYSLRNRLLYARKHYKPERARYLARWLGLCFGEFGKAIVHGRLGRARAILLAVTHGCTNRFGDRNAAFL